MPFVTPQVCAARRRLSLVLVPLFLGVLWVAVPARAQGVPGADANKCLAGKTKCVAKKLAGLLKCREKCQQSPAKCGASQTACEDKVIAKFDGGLTPAKGCFAKLEAKDDPAKPDSVCTTTGDTGALETLADGAVATLVGTLEGAPPAVCGNGVVEAGEACDFGDLNGHTCATEGFYGDGLACTPGTCALDTSACAPSRYVDSGLTVLDLETGLEWEKKTPCPAGYESDDVTYTTAFPTNGSVDITVDASGTTWTGTATDSLLGGPVACSGTVVGTTFTGSCDFVVSVTVENGTIDCGARTLSFDIAGITTGSGSGTITASPVHDVYRTFTWSPGSPWGPTGTAFTDFLTTLNGGVTGVGNCTSGDGASQTGGFAGHCDWRLPTITELLTIVDLGAAGCGSGPCIDPIFGPTEASYYWSSTSNVPSNAWDVLFISGSSVNSMKFFPDYVRAVRGGS